tara:strand:- start:61972 stop:63108 length:1137 start_codon:yes stop_codon:yes gene_type:complete
MGFDIEIEYDELLKANTFTMSKGQLDLVSKVHKIENQSATIVKCGVVGCVAYLFQPCIDEIRKTITLEEYVDGKLCHACRTCIVYTHTEIEQQWDYHRNRDYVKGNRVQKVFDDDEPFWWVCKNLNCNGHSGQEFSYLASCYERTRKNNPITCSNYNYDEERVLAYWKEMYALQCEYNNSSRQGRNRKYGSNIRNIVIPSYYVSMIENSVKDNIPNLKPVHDLSKHSNQAKLVYGILTERFNISPYNIELEWEDPTNLRYVNPLYIDFCIPSLNLFVEVDGVQHFPKSYRNNDEITGMQRDLTKDLYAMNRRVNLIRIPYNMEAEKIYSYLDEILGNARTNKWSIFTYQRFLEHMYLNRLISSECVIKTIPCPQLKFG